METVRLDQFLCASRIFKSRTQAARACDEGHVRVNGEPARPARPVRIGDEIRARAPRGDVVLDILKLADKRLSPPLARELYTDRSPPPPPYDPLAARDRGAGRPTKQQRRALLKLRGPQ
jgi:ribosome-associated heat shock protein Hsp15